MTLQYIITGGQLDLEKTAFTRELLAADSPLKRMVYGTGEKVHGNPKIVKEASRVVVDFNQSEVETDEGFYDIFRKMKEKYGEKLRGKVVIRITALTSYYVTLNFDGDKVLYE